MWRPLLFLLLPVAMLALAPALGLSARLAELADWIRALGPWGPVAYVAAYVVGTVAAMPISVLAACAGVLFPAAIAFPVLVVSATLGATCAFALARTVGRASASRWLEGNPRLAALDAALERRGPIVVALARVTPFVPFGMMNYALGLTSVRPATFVLYTFLGVIPGSALNAVGAATIAGALRSGEVSWTMIGLGVGLVVLAIALGRYAYGVIWGGT